MAPSNFVDDPNAEALRASQIALKSVDTQPGYVYSLLSSILGPGEDSTQWTRYEELLVSCLKTGDAKTAQAILERLISRFGAANERVMGLRGLYQEAVASDSKALEAVLREYEEILKDSPTNIPVAKRRVALLRSLQQPEKAVEYLVELVKISPTDIEAWSELSDLYLSLGKYSQAAFALEEVLLVLPNAWNVHARIGEVLVISTSASGIGKGDVEIALSNAIRRYCRSIELCDGYLRGNYGLGLATEKYLALFGDARTSSTNTSAVSVEDAQRLNKQALNELQRIVDAKGFSYDQNEIDAAREFLRKRT